MTDSSLPAAAPGRAVGPSSASSWRRDEARLAWVLALPALGIIALVALFPILWTIWESLHLHDLQMPWLGRPFVGAANYVEALSDERLWRALAHTASFVAMSVSLELAVGLVLAVALEKGFRARELVRTAILLPWAIPTAVVALVWRFMFESPAGLATALLTQLGVTPPTWFADAVAAWIPLVLADVWKTTPFVALLLLAGLQNIDRSVYEAAEVDGAGPWRQFVEITLPLLRPALLVALLFRTLDAFRVFDVVYVMTGGGPGTATEPIALYAFSTLLQHLRFGLGSALSVIIFAVAFVFALVSIRSFGASALQDGGS
jgi:multiple sugar transport system permease protein